jgi:uncharacterized membrane protein YtjA (UPF0391 family)
MALLRWALLFLILSGVAALFGFGNLAEGFGDIARVLFVVFLVIFAILAFLGWSAYRAVSPSRP